MTDDSASPELLRAWRTALERAGAVAQQVVGLSLHDANELAGQSGCELREVRRDGRAFAIRGDFRTSRISVETEGGVVATATVG